MPVKAGAPFGRLLHMAGVQRLVLRPGEESAHPVVEDTAEARVCRYADALPRAFIVHRGRRVKDEAESLRATFEADLTREVVLPADTPDPPAVGLPPSDKDEVRWQRLGPNRIMAFPRMASPGWMVLTESWSPGWEAHTGLGRTPVLRANHAFMAVALPAGTHVVSLVYRPRAFFVGAWTSGATLLALAAWAAGLAVKAAVERRKGGAA
jgi:hypothetical protein